MSIKVVSKIEVAEGKLEEAKTLFAELVAESRKEEGCIFYALHEDIDDPTVLCMLEEWESREHLATHGKSPHYKHYTALLKDCKKGGELRFYRQIV